MTVTLKKKRKKNHDQFAKDLYKNLKHKLAKVN